MYRLVTTSFVLTVASSLGFARVTEHTPTDDYPKYAYKYSVNDPVTKDIKQHWEARDGEYVKGSYSLVEPDGKLRVVDYWVDDTNGFIADVKRAEEIEHLPYIDAVKAIPVTEIPVTEVTEFGENDDYKVNPEIPEPEMPLLEITPPAETGVLKPLTPPANYGFGAGGDIAPLGQLYANIKSGSHRWDPKTGSYGGWVPLTPPVKKYATIFSKKYIDGKLHKWAIGPISLVGRTLVFKVKH